MAMNNTSSPPETRETWTSAVSWNVKDGKRCTLRRLDAEPVRSARSRFQRAAAESKNAAHRWPLLLPCYCLTITKWINCRFLATNIQAQVCMRLGWPILNWNCLANSRIINKGSGDSKCEEMLTVGLQDQEVWFHSYFGFVQKRKRMLRNWSSIVDCGHIIFLTLDLIFSTLPYFFSFQFGVWKSSRTRISCRDFSYFSPPSRLWCFFLSGNGLITAVAGYPWGWILPYSKGSLWTNYFLGRTNQFVKHYLYNYNFHLPHHHLCWSSQLRSRQDMTVISSFHVMGPKNAE